jgi:ribose/xylose/arabinose/galactoside ABC-type transport system permease subunit
VSEEAGDATPEPKAVGSGGEDLSAWEWLRGQTHDREVESVGLIGVLVLVIVVFSLTSPYFLTSGNYTALALAIVVTGILAAGQTVVLVSGSIDLSFTSVLALAGIVAEEVYLQTGHSLALAILAALAAGTAAGLVNALIVVRFRVNALIATIGTQFMFMAVCYLWLGSSQLPYLSGAFAYIGNGKIGGVPFPFILMIVVFAALWLMMKFTRFGWRVYAVGGGAVAARLSGVSVPKLRTIVFVLSGLTAGLCGVLETSLDGTAVANAQAGNELLVLACVIVGGTALTGGRGSLIGTALGVLLLGVVTDGLNLAGANPYWEVFMSGAILVFAVVIDEARRERAEPG